MTSDRETTRIASTIRLRDRDGYYLVPSSDGTQLYRTGPTSCTCPAFTKRGLVCKHRFAVELLCPPAVRVKGPV